MPLKEAWEALQSAALEEQWHTQVTLQEEDQAMLLSAVKKLERHTMEEPWEEAATTLQNGV